MRNISKGFLVALIIIGIYSYSSAFSTPPLTATAQLEVILKTDKEVYSPYEPVLMQLTVINKRKAVFKSAFSSAQRYDFLVRREGREVWRWSNEKVFAMALTGFTLKPQESATYSEKWVSQERADSGPVAQGRYEIVGILKTKPQIVSNSVFIEIRDRNPL